MAQTTAKNSSFFQLSSFINFALYFELDWDVSSARIERQPSKLEVEGSNPSRPALNWIQFLELKDKTNVSAAYFTSCTWWKVTLWIHRSRPFLCFLATSVRQRVGRYIVDILKGNTAIEAKTKNFSTLKEKLETLSREASSQSGYIHSSNQTDNVAYPCRLDKFVRSTHLCR